MPFRQSRREFINQTLGVTGALGSTLPFAQLGGGDRPPIFRLAATKSKSDSNNVFRRHSNVEPRPLGG